jgi:adenylyltransferase/sulfurtransferase
MKLDFDDRYARQNLIEWWDQKRVAGARMLVIGAGALGNEVVKNLALVGVGSIVLYDPDRIERSNLSRGVLFRDEDEGKLKAEVVARRASELNPDVKIAWRGENVINSAGLGEFASADVVIGCVDNREARVFVNAACARVGKAWVDGAIEGLSGIVRAFDPARGACYECTMNATDRKLLAERRSCAMLARDVVARGHVPTTAVAASIVGAWEAQTAIKILHGQPALVGEGLHLHGLWDDVSRVKYTRRDDCPGHDSYGALVEAGVGVDVSLKDLLDRAESKLGEGAVIDLSRDVVLSLTCPKCGAVTDGGVVLGSLREKDATCPACGEHRVLDVTASLSREHDQARTLARFGVPAHDVVVARNGVEKMEAWLLS